MENWKIPVILDCDPGIDDAFAITLAASFPDFELKAVTAVGGNLDLEVTYGNVRSIAAYLGLDARIAKGSAEPLIRSSERAGSVHGERGLGYASLPPSGQPEEETLAWDLIHEEALKGSGSLVLFALGPLTNVALALLKYPDLKEHLKEIRIMGGSAGAGNHSPYGEFNIWADPHAAQIVFESGIPLYIHGLHLTSQGALSREELEEVAAASGLNELLDGLIEYLFDPSTPYYRKDGAVLHDAMTVASLMDDSLMTYRSARVSCELTSELSLGRTVMDFRREAGFDSNAEVAMTMDRSVFLRILKDMAGRYSDRMRV